MKGGWKAVALGEVLELKYGKALDKTKRDHLGQIPVLGANGVKDWSHHFLAEGPCLIVGRKGSAGEINRIDGPFWALDVTYYTNHDPSRIDFDYMAHILSFLNLPSLARGVKPGINRNDVYSLSIPLPPLEEQQAIVDILDEAFAGLEKARANAEANLESAEELFQSIADAILFDSNGSRDTYKLEQVCDLITCGVAARPDYVDDGIPFLSAQNVKRGNIIWSNFKYVSEETHLRLNKKNNPEPGDLLYTRVGSYGEAAVVEHDMPFSIFVSLTLIKVGPNLNSQYLKYFLNSSRIKRFAASQITSSGVGNLNVGAVRRFPIPVPSIKQQITLADELKARQIETDRLQEEYKRQISDLDELKQSLLQKAFAGELT